MSTPGFSMKGEAMNRPGAAATQSWTMARSALLRNPRTMLWRSIASRVFRNDSSGVAVAAPSG